MVSTNPQQERPGGALPADPPVPPQGVAAETTVLAPVSAAPSAPQAWGLAEGQVLESGGISAVKGLRPLPDPTAGALLGESGAETGRDLVTCPECGLMAEVSPARREAADFCTGCDFPLFWARSTVILPSSEATGASLRRLPGTVGRAAVAAVPCPHCGEPNDPAAALCVRCSLSMVVAPPPPPPPPPVHVPPPPLPELPPDPPRSTWIWWVLAVLTLVVVGFTVWALVR